MGIVVRKGSIEKRTSAGSSYEKISNFHSLDRMLQKHFYADDMKPVYNNIIDSLGAGAGAKDFSIEHFEDDKIRRLSYKGTILGDVYKKDELEDILYEVGKQSREHLLTRREIKELLEATIDSRDIVDVTIKKRTEDLDKKIEATEHDPLDKVFLNGKKVSSLKLKAGEKNALLTLLADAQEGYRGAQVWVKGKDGYLLKNNGDTFNLAKLTEDLPNKKQFSKRSDAYSDISKKANKFAWIAIEDTLSIPFAEFLDDIREAQDRGMFKKRFAKKNKFTNHQLARLEEGFTELLELANDTSELKGKIMEKYGFIPDVWPTTVVSVLDQQTRNSGYVNITDWLTSEMFDFDGRRAQSYIEEIVATSPAIQVNTSPHTLATFMEVQTDTDIEDVDFVETSSRELVEGYLASLDLPEGDAQAAMFKAALAKRMFARPEEVATIAAAGNFTADQLHEIAFSAYTSKKLLKVIKAQQRDTDLQQLFTENELLWSDSTDDPLVGSKASLFFNSFADVHKLPFGNVRAVFKNIYGDDFTPLVANIDAANDVQAVLGEFGMDRILEDGLVGGGFDRMAEHTNMTPKQAAGWKRIANIAVVAGLAYKILWEGLIMGKRKGGRRTAIATLLGLQLGAQAMTGEGIMAFGGKLLNGGLNEVDILGFTGDDKEKTKEMRDIAKAHQDFLPVLGGSILVGTIFGDMTKQEAMAYLTPVRGADGEIKTYKIKDKAGLMARHGEDSWRSILLRKKDEEINDLLAKGFSSLDRESFPSGTLVADSISGKMKEQAKEIERRTAMAEEIATLKNQFAPYTIDQDTQSAYIAIETHGEVKKRLEELTELRPMISEDLLKYIPGLTAKQKLILTGSVIPAVLSPLLNDYVRGDKTQDELYEAIAQELGEPDNGLVTKVSQVLDGTISNVELRIASLTALTKELEKEMHNRGPLVDQSQRNLHISPDGKYIWSYNEYVAFDITKRVVTHEDSGEVLDLGLTSDRELIKVANLIDFIITTYRGRVKPDFISYLKKTDEPFSFTEEGKVTKKPAIEVEVFEGWNVGLFNPEVLSYEGMEYISPILTTDKGRNTLLKYLNKLYKAGVFNL